MRLLESPERSWNQWAQSPSNSDVATASVGSQARWSRTNSLAMEYTFFCRSISRSSHASNRRRVAAAIRVPEFHRQQRRRRVRLRESGSLNLNRIGFDFSTIVRRPFCSESRTRNWWIEQIKKNKKLRNRQIDPWLHVKSDREEVELRLTETIERRILQNQGNLNREVEEEGEKLRTNNWFSKPFPLFLVSIKQRRIGRGWLLYIWRGLLREMLKLRWLTMENSTRGFWAHIVRRRYFQEADFTNFKEKK